MSYDIETTGIQTGTVNGIEYKPTSHIEIDSTKVDATLLTTFEETIYGVAGGASPRMPLPAEVFTLFGGSSIPFVELDKHYLALKVGDEYTFSVSKNPSDAEVSFSSGSDSVATVTAGGKVEAAGTGSTTITATYTDSQSVVYSDTCTVVVSAAG